MQTVREQGHGTECGSSCDFDDHHSEGDDDDDDGASLAVLLLILAEGVGVLVVVFAWLGHW